MANFLFSQGDNGRVVGMNVDAIRNFTVNDDKSVTVYFAPDHQVELDPKTGREFFDVVTRLNSEASAAFEAARNQSKK